MSGDEIAERLADSAARFPPPATATFLQIRALDRELAREPVGQTWAVFQDLLRLGVIGWAPGHDPSRFFLG